MKKQKIKPLIFHFYKGEKRIDVKALMTLGAFLILMILGAVILQFGIEQESIFLTITLVFLGLVFMAPLFVIFASERYVVWLKNERNRYRKTLPDGTIIESENYSIMKTKNHFDVYLKCEGMKDLLQESFYHSSNAVSYIVNLENDLLLRETTHDTSMEEFDCLYPEGKEQNDE